nr:unnamed protein product [Spirometra erinaceieuropaei]
MAAHTYETIQELNFTAAKIAAHTGDKASRELIEAWVPDESPVIVPIYRRHTKPCSVTSRPASLAVDCLNCSSGFSTGTQLSSMAEIRMLWRIHAHGASTPRRGVGARHGRRDRLRGIRADQRMRQGCALSPAILTLMFFVILMEAYRDERPGSVSPTGPMGIFSAVSTCRPKYVAPRLSSRICSSQANMHSTPQRNQVCNGTWISSPSSAPTSG